MVNKSTSQKREVLDFVREWVTPILITIVGVFIWRDISELRSDVKQLLSQQAVDKTQIQQIQYDIVKLKECVYKNAFNTSIPIKNEEKTEDDNHNEVGLKEDNDFIIMNQQDENS